MIATVAHHGDLAVAHGRYALQQKMLRVARVTKHDDLTDPCLPARRENEKPVPYPPRRLHAVAGDGHAPGSESHFLVA
jgi:hypothetical protein